MTTTETVRIPVTALVPVYCSSQAGRVADEDLLSVLLLAEEADANQLIALLTKQLHKQAASLSNNQVSAVIRILARFGEQREAAKYATDSGHHAGVERAGKTFASRD